jgi:hypothetical protein
MTVKELKQALAELDSKYDDHLVIMQKDSEGNGYSPMYQMDKEAFYVPDNTWSGEVYAKSTTASEMDMDEESWKNLKTQGQDCIVVVPTN